MKGEDEKVQIFKDCILKKKKFENKTEQINPSSRISDVCANYHACIRVCVKNIYLEGYNLDTVL